MIREIAFTDVLLLVAVVGVLFQIRRLHRGSGFHRDAGLAPGAEGRSSRRRFGILALECLELILAAVFFVVGIAKLIGRPEMVSLFDHIGVGQWLRYATGSIEVAGATLLVIPALSGEAALLLGGVMIAATLIELFVLHRPPVAALACLSGHATVAGARASRRVRAWLHHPAAVEPKPSQWPKLPRRKRPSAAVVQRIGVGRPTRYEASPRRVPAVARHVPASSGPSTRAIDSTSLFHRSASDVNCRRPTAVRE